MTRTVSATEDEVEAAKHILALLDSTDDRVGVLMSALDGARDGCAIRSQAALAAESRARAEAEAREAVLREALQDISDELPCDEPCATDLAMVTCPTCLHSSAPAWCAGCTARRALATPSPIALALVELERAARETAFGAGSIAAPDELRTALANLDRARGDR